MSAPPSAIAAGPKSSRPCPKAAGSHGPLLARHVQNATCAATPSGSPRSSSPNGQGVLIRPSAQTVRASPGDQRGNGREHLLRRRHRIVCDTQQRSELALTAPHSLRFGRKRSAQAISRTPNPPPRCAAPAARFTRTPRTPWPSICTPLLPSYLLLSKTARPGLGGADAAGRCAYSFAGASPLTRIPDASSPPAPTGSMVANINSSILLQVAGSSILSTWSCPAGIQQGRKKSGLGRRTVRDP